jgi:hypothetical protein
LLTDIIEELLDRFKTRDSDFGESVDSPESRLAEGMHYDRNKAPALQDREKERSEKVDVEGGSSRSVYVFT